jgi:hypothetical protein
MRKSLFRGGSILSVLLFWALLCASLPAAAAESGFVTGLNTYPLRENPQFSDPPAARLPVGTKLTLLERREGWVHVKAGEKTGWMPNSVIGKEAPPAVRIGPLRERMKETESRLGRLVEENNGLQGRNESLSERVTLLEEELASSRSVVSRARNSKMFQGVALGGGLVIFGWITGYALASRSGRKRMHGKLVID